MGIGVGGDRGGLDKDGDGGGRGYGWARQGWG